MTALPPTVDASAAAIRRRELERAYARLGGREALDQAEREVLEALADALVEGVLRRPSMAVEQGVDPSTAVELLPTDVEG